MNAATEVNESFVAPAAASHEVRPFYWSVRRELWENRSLLIAPLVAGGIVVLALLGMIVRGLTSGDVPDLSTIPPEVLGQGATAVYAGIAYAVSIVMHITVFFYALDALQGERKDRSVLFWKSMPISDTTTVLSKLFTALIVSGAVVIAVALATQIVVLLLATVVALIGGVNPLHMWGGQLLQMTVAIVYWQITIALWYAPVVGWLLLVSAWAKRVTILWAVFIPLGIAIFERVAIGTKYVQSMINYRITDPVFEQFRSHARGAELTVGSEGVKAHGIAGRVFDGIDPVAFLSNPWLWVGLVAAAGFIAAAIWMRRYREPL